MKICLVGATHVCHNPRLVREADSLAACGHEVVVVAPSIFPGHAERDLRLLARRKWRLQAFDYSGQGLFARLGYRWTRGMPRLQGKLFAVFRQPRFAARGLLAGSSGLERLATREKADWYIAHAQGALPVAARAALRWGARLGFDLEDILTLSPQEPVAMLRSVERKWIPRAEYVSVPSEAIAARLKAEFPDCRVVCLYNVFPRELAAALESPEQRPRRPGPVRLHWLGQTIGPGRGLHLAIEGIAPLADRVELHLRGTRHAVFYGEILAHARQRGVRMVAHPLLDHDELISSLRDFDVGLALERPDFPAAALTVSNKFLAYLLGGLAIAASDTEGQREGMSLSPHSGFLFDPREPAQLTAGLAGWIENPERLLSARKASWKAARERLCWDVEQEKFLALLRARDGA